ncbi:MAG: class II fumarate hydratase [Acidobacteriota bacterium]|nr:MAG: class II fumarate hydratase [Acidobacteriota bacterium]
MRIERDSLGEVEIPDNAYYGAQTARAIENFPISGLRFSRRFIRALGLIKLAAARANIESGDLSLEIGEAIVQASTEVAEGRWDGEFVVDIFQTGSGTSTNMNANEVIANRAAEILGHQRGAKIVHPNDHVNMSQSSNDVIPTAIHVSAALAITEDLLPALEHLRGALSSKALEFDQVIKSGRTHLMDATPVRLGQEFSGYAEQIAKAGERLQRGRDSLLELPLGGTAVGTGINRRQEFPSRAIARLVRDTGLQFREARNHFEAQGARDACVEVSGRLRTLACSLIKIANDIRWMASGPRAGLAEIRLPAIQPGSSIMPGKVNPVICEAVMMVAAQVIGCDATIAVCGMSGNFELNAMMPVMAWNLLHSIELVSSACRVFADKSISGITADEERCRETVERNLALATALAPLIGYDRAAEIAKEAYASNRDIREIARERGVLSDEELDAALDPVKMTGPSQESR